MNDNNSNNNAESSGQSPKGSPFLSARGQYNPNLTQQQAQPNSYEQQAQPSNYEQQPNSNPYQQQIPPNQQFAPPMQTKLKHSGLGISSFVLSIIAIISFILCFVLVIVGTVDLLNNGSFDINELADPTAVQTMLLEGDSLSGGLIFIAIGGLFVLVSIAFGVIGLILGIIGAAQKKRKKVFAILGIVFNGFVLLGFLFSTIMGL